MMGTHNSGCMIPQQTRSNQISAISSSSRMNSLNPANSPMFLMLNDLYKCLNLATTLNSMKNLMKISKLETCSLIHQIQNLQNLSTISTFTCQHMCLHLRLLLTRLALNHNGQFLPSSSSD